MLDPARVHPDQSVGEVLEHALHRPLTAGHAAFADAIEPVIGLDFDHVLVAMPNLDRNPLTAVIFTWRPLPASPGAGMRG